MTRAHHRPDTARGWQAAPGQPMPRAARQPAAKRSVAGHADVGLVLAAVHCGLAGRAGGDLAPAPLALVALHPGRPRLDRRRPARRPRAGATGSDDLARIRRIIAALLRKAAATSFPHEAAACREKAEALRAKYGL
jgi:hypothetical protein